MWPNNLFLANLSSAEYSLNCLYSLWGGMAGSLAGAGAFVSTNVDPNDNKLLWPTL